MKVPKAVKGKPAPVAPRPYLENSQKLADQFRVTYDNEVQLREKRNEIEELTEILDGKKRGLLTVQAKHKTEQADIDSMKTANTSLESDLQKSTSAFEQKQLSFLNDIVALEGRLDSMSKQ